MTTLKPMTDAHAAEILDKLIVELAFVADNADVRAEKTAQQYAATLISSSVILPVRTRSSNNPAGLRPRQSSRRNNR